jgi:hypothetical protein
VRFPKQTEDFRGLAARPRANCFETLPYTSVLVREVDAALGLARLRRLGDGFGLAVSEFLAAGVVWAGVGFSKSGNVICILL